MLLITGQSNLKHIDESMKTMMSPTSFRGAVTSTRGQPRSGEIILETPRP